MFAANVNFIYLFFGQLGLHYMSNTVGVTLSCKDIYTPCNNLAWTRQFLCVHRLTYYYRWIFAEKLNMNKDLRGQQKH